MDNGWRIKALHKAIVTSATYRQSSASRPAVDARDPGNTLLARQTRLRLPAELIRDAILSVSELLVSGRWREECPAADSSGRR